MANGKDIGEPKLTEQDYKALDPSKIDEDLHRLFVIIQDKAYQAIDWYSKARKRKRFLAQWIRFLSIVLFSAAGLVPVLDSVGLLQQEPLVISIPEGASPQQLADAVKGASEAFNIGQLGYLFAALAAALIGLDKFFGLSSGWTRYILADLNIKKSLGRFQMDWVMANACLEEGDEETKRPKERLQLLKDFSIEISTIIEEETKLWATEFQSALAALEKTVGETKEARRPGSLQVTVEKGKDVTGSVAVFVDGELRRTSAGRTTVMTALEPGSHEVQAVGTNAKGDQISDSKIVNVPAGGTASVTLKLE